MNCRCIFFERELKDIPMINPHFRIYDAHYNKPPSITRGAMTLPTDATARKNIPIVTGVLDYFPAALAEVAKLSKLGNEKHNPGQPLHHARGKSTDHADCIGRHMIDRGVIDPDTGLDHMVEVCWRSLALLQEIMESRGAPLARGARLPEKQEPAKTEFQKTMERISNLSPEAFEAEYQKAYKDLLNDLELRTFRISAKPAKRRGKSRGQVKANHHGRRRKARK